MQSCKWLHSYIFSTVSSNYLPEKMQGRIGCICTLFHQGSFRMFSKIACMNRCKVTNGCIHTFFFNCLLKLSARTDAKWHWLHLSAFSPEWVFKCVLKLPACTDAKSHWLHLNAFSNVSSNCLPEQMQSCIDCIWMLFSRVSFQMCPQIACL